MNLKPLINLYRKLGRPEFSASVSRSFYHEFLCTDKIKPLLMENVSFIESIEVNGGYTTTDKISLINAGDKINLKITALTQGIPLFFFDISDFIKVNNKKIRDGLIPDEFYIVDIDYYSNSDEINTKIENLKTVCQLIRSLRLLAHYGDKGKLLFFRKSTSFYQPLPLDIIVSKDINLDNEIDLSIIESLLGNHNNDPHFFEKREIFINSIIEFLSDNDNKFVCLINNWNDLLNIYSNNLSAYLSDFSFNKMRKKIVEETINLSNRLTKTISDIEAKLLGIPASLVAAFAMLIKVNDKGSVIITSISVVITSIILYITVSNQKKLLNLIKQSKDDLFMDLMKKNGTYSSDITALIDSSKESLEKQVKSTSIWLLAFQLAAWLPTVAVFCYLTYINLPTE